MKKELAGIKSLSELIGAIKGIEAILPIIREHLNEEGVEILDKFLEGLRKTREGFEILSELDKKLKEEKIEEVSEG